MILGGFTMHRIAGDNINPAVDTHNKIASINKYILPNSRILDTCMGLGYTAIAAARGINQHFQSSVSSISTPTSTFSRGSTGCVTTIEYDEASIEMCAYNPWSKQLFDNSLPINIIQVCDFASSC